MLGTRIAILRRSAGLSQAQLAQRLKISPSAVGMYEQGRRQPSAQLLVALAQELQVSVDYLLTGAPTQTCEKNAGSDALLCCLAELDKRLPARPSAFSRQELITLFAALMLET